MNTDHESQDLRRSRRPKEMEPNYNNEIKELNKLLSHLKENTYNLRSSLTALILHIEEMQSLTEDKKNCAIDICQVINTKNNEVIYSEKLLKEVLEKLLHNTRREPLPPPSRGD